MLWNGVWQMAAHNNYQLLLSLLLLFPEFWETREEVKAGWEGRDYGRGMNLRDASKF